jgi:hypothetical protein
VIPKGAGARNSSPRIQDGKTYGHFEALPNELTTIIRHPDRPPAPVPFLWPALQAPVEDGAYGTVSGVMVEHMDSSRRPIYAIFSLQAYQTRQRHAC